MAPVGLEARYRRLLRWFPADHQAVHRDEMLGVLMESAEPGRSRPRLADSVDLMLGAARIRVRPRQALSDRSGWRDALAVYSIAAPVLVLTSTLIGWLVVVVWARLTGQATFYASYTDLAATSLLHRASIGLLIEGQGLVAVLALLGLRRWAAAAAAIPALYFGIAAILQLYTPLSVGIPISVLYIPFTLVAPISETVALLASPGPRLGRQLMRRRDWALVAVGSAAAALLTLNFDAVLQRGGWDVYVVGVTLAGIVAGLLLLVLWLSSAHGKRLALLFAVLGYGLLLSDGFIDRSGSWGADTVNGAAGQVVVLCLVAAVCYRTWRRSRSATGGPGQGQT